MAQTDEEALGLIIKAINKLLKTENELNFRFHFYTNEKPFFKKTSILQLN